MAHQIIDNVPVGRLFLSLNNPRHEPTATEAQTIEYLCEKEGVYPLARDITNHGISPLERVALVPVPGQQNAYTMAEGNRRLCALKLLADPDLAPAKYRRGFTDLAKRWKPIKTLSAAVFDENDPELRVWLKRIHNGFQGGAGRKNWGSEENQRFSGSSKNRIAQLFLDYAQAEGMISKEDRQGKLTTVQRFLGKGVMQEAMGLDPSNSEELARTRPKEEFDIIARRFIRDLLDTTEPRAVTSRKNKPDIIAYSRPLNTLPGVTAARVEPEPLSSSGGSVVSKPGSRGRAKPKKPAKVRKVEYFQEIMSALQSFGNYKLQSLYHSICEIELDHHTPIVCVGAWSFFETLTACAGRKEDVAFLDFFSKLRLGTYGIASKSIPPARSAIGRIADYGNATKHHPTAAAFNGDQLNNDMVALKSVILKCIEEAAKTP
jgi:hypothetical protein